MVLTRFVAAAVLLLFGAASAEAYNRLDPVQVAVGDYLNGCPAPTDLGARIQRTMNERVHQLDPNGPRGWECSIYEVPPNCLTGHEALCRDLKSGYDAAQHAVRITCASAAAAVAAASPWAALAKAVCATALLSSAAAHYAIQAAGC